MGDVTSSSLRQKHMRQLMKTEMCKFFLANRCEMGARCAFAHSLSEIREKPNLNCTSMCKWFLQTGTCHVRGCTFAHDERQLRTTAGFFKTKLCRFAASGRCKHGASCRFAHHAVELPPDGPWPSSSGGGAESAMPEMGSAGAHFALLHQFEREIQARGGGQQHRQQQEQQGQQPYYGGSQTSGHWTQDLSSEQGGREMGSGSDQSTRAETSASVPTPEGSGGDSGRDSGPEESPTTQAGQQRRAGGGLGPEERGSRRAERRAAERLPARHCSTMMLTNVPTFLTPGALVSLLEDLTLCMRGAFDFFFCPWDPIQDRNLGYAIINFFSRATAAEFERKWENQPLLPRNQSTKRLRIVPAALQGRSANLRHFSGFSLAHHEDPRFRPLVRAAPNQPLRPMAISQEFRSQQSDGEEGQAVACSAPPKEVAAFHPDRAACGSFFLGGQAESAEDWSIQQQQHQPTQQQHQPMPDSFLAVLARMGARSGTAALPVQEKVAAGSTWPAAPDGGVCPPYWLLQQAPQHDGGCVAGQDYATAAAALAELLIPGVSMGDYGDHSLSGSGAAMPYYTGQTQQQRFAYLPQGRSSSSRLQAGFQEDALYSD